MLQGCGESVDIRYDYGYDERYDITCEIGAKMFKGDWNDEHYSRGYRDGYAARSLARKKRK